MTVMFSITLISYVMLLTIKTLIKTPRLSVRIPKYLTVYEGHKQLNYSRYQKLSIVQLNHKFIYIYER